MDFSVYRGKIRLLRITGSLLSAVAAAGTVGGVLNLLIRLELIELSAFFGLFIGFLVGAATFAVAYLLMRMSGKRLAKKLDNDFSLSERVQTTLEYEGRREAIYELQREDTRSALSKIDPKMLRSRRLPICILCAVIGISILACSFLFKKNVPPEIPPEDPPFALTEIQEAALLELIDTVGVSEMDAHYRDGTVAALTELLSTLRAATLTSERDSALADALKTVYDITDASSFLLELAEQIYARGTDPCKELARAINYYVYTADEEWDDFTEGLTLFRVTFISQDVLGDAPDPLKMSEQTRELLSLTVSDLGMAFTRSGITSDDILYGAIKAMLDDGEYGFTALAASELDYEALQDAIDKAVAASTTAIFDAVMKNKINTDTGEYAMKRLAAIFSYPCPAFERPRLRDSSGNDPLGGAGNEQGGGQGAIGSGTVFGSDDLVLDPNTDEYVEYGTIIMKYYEIVFGKIEGDSYTDEEKAAMEKYFEILFGTAKD